MLPIIFTIIRICYLFVTTVTYFASGKSRKYKKMSSLNNKIFKIKKIFLHPARNATLTDISKCKLTQLGTEYIGSVTITAGGIRCQSWFSKKNLDEVNQRNN